VLSQLPRTADPALLVGTETADDAGVYRITDDLALVQTADLFPPVVDDPYAFGAIAAANALSDVYAMGGRPLTALNLVGWPSGVLDFEVLGQVMRGGAEKLAEAGTTLVGGHSWDDAEPKYGLSVTGVIDPRRIVANATAQPGDALVLTKPLGVGIITTAIKQDRVSEATIARATRVMATLNRDAAEAMLEVGVHAATDVTGFGLLGHLREMTTGSGVGAELVFGSIPFLEEARELAAEGAIAGGTRRNLAAVLGFVDFGDLDETEQLLVADAQTSGGLLIAVQPERLNNLLARLRERGTPAASHIGRLTDDLTGSIRIARS
jgi:selenide, water dikinase